jgi:hypothetical protein
MEKTVATNRLQKIRGAPSEAPRRKSGFGLVIKLQSELDLPRVVRSIAG